MDGDFMDKNKVNTNMIKKTAIVLAIITLIVFFKALGLDEYLTLSSIKSSQAGILDLYAENGIVTIASYTAIYILVTALSLPGAAVMTVLSGAIFGLWTGAIIVSFSSTIGATLACLVSRFLLRDWVQGKFGDKLKTVNAGIDNEGALYLFTLRLVPVFPFFIVNLVMGLTRMRMFTYSWVSQVGMLAGTMVYVNAGKELGKIESLSGILSPGLILSFALLGLFPFIVKKCLPLIKARFAASV